MRKNVVIATKTMCHDAEGFWADLDTSLKRLNTDYIDVYQFHNPPEVPRPDDPDGACGGLYEAMLEAKRQGRIRFIGITNHKIGLAEEAVKSGLYDTVQYPFSFLSSGRDIGLVRLCAEKDVGFIAMKALSGGLITNVRAVFAYIYQFGNVVPIWGAQYMREMEEFIALAGDPPALDGELKSAIEDDKKALSGDFCRGCGYCMPCRAGIDLSMAARIYWFITRAPYKYHISPAYQREMAKVEGCVRCGDCRTRCPYGLDTPELIRRQYELYKRFVREHRDEIEPET